MRVNLAAPEKSKIKALAAADPLLSAMMGATPAQIDTWVENNMTNLVQSRDIMKRVIKVLVFLLRQQID